MPILVGASYYAEFITSNPTTGAAVNADSLPTATATHNGTDDGSFTLTVTNIDTGRYKVTGTIPGGYSANDYVQVSVAATVSSVAGKAVIDSFQVGVATLTAAAIATGVWQDATGGDFTVSSSIGKSLYTSGVAPGASGGLFIAGTNAATTITTSLTTHLVGTVDTVTTVTNQLTAAQVATGIWQDATAGDFTTSSSIGKSLYTSGNIPGAAGGLFVAGTNAATTITTALTTTFTGNLTGSVGSVTGNVGSVTGNVGGNVTGTIGGLTAAALAGLFTVDTTKLYADAISGSVVKEIASHATATVSGTVDANVVSINSVSATSVAAVGANIGTAQPVNFTGTSTSALVKTEVDRLIAAALAQFVTLDTTKTASDIAAGSVVYLSRHSIAGIGF